MRRVNRSREPEEEFAAWLDALARGEELPPNPAGNETADQTAIKETALFARRAAQPASLGGVERTRIQEEIMAISHQPTARLPLDTRRSEPSRHGPTRTAVPRALLRGRFSPLVSGAMAVLLLVAIMAAYGGMQGALDSGHRNGPPVNAPESPAFAAATLPNPQDCDTRPLSRAELQKIVTAPYEQRVNAIGKGFAPVDVVDGAAIMHAYQQIRDCALSTSDGDALYALLSPHAVQEVYWRGASLSGLTEVRGPSSSGPDETRGPLSGLVPTPAADVSGTVPAGTPATPQPAITPAVNTSFTWQPTISKTDTYAAAIHIDSMEVLKDGRVFAPVDWTNGEAKGLNSPLTALVFIKIDGQWRLDDWIFGTQILTDAGR